MWKTLQRAKFNTTTKKKQLLSDKSPLTPEGKQYLTKQVEQLEAKKNDSNGKENKV